MSKSNDSTSIKNVKAASKQGESKKQSVQDSPQSRAFYVEQTAWVLETTIKRTQPVLTEMVTRMKRFETISDLNEAERIALIATLSNDKSSTIENEFAKRGLSYEKLGDIELLKQSQDFKLNVRNILGVQHCEDWIFNLNIGNVMHLSSMSIDELNYPTDLTHELNKDAMLEKIILVCTSYFCLGTEYRFLARPEGQTDEGEKLWKKGSVISSDMEKSFPRCDSDMWHAQAVYMSTSFLPA